MFSFSHDKEEKGITQLKKKKKLSETASVLEKDRFRTWLLVKNCMYVATLNEKIRTC